MAFPEAATVDKLVPGVLPLLCLMPLIAGMKHNLGLLLSTSRRKLRAPQQCRNLALLAPNVSGKCEAIA